MRPGQNTDARQNPLSRSRSCPGHAALILFRRMNAQRYLLLLLFLAGVFVPLNGQSSEMTVTEPEPLPTVQLSPKIDSGSSSKPTGEPAGDPLEGLTIALDIGHTKESPGAYSARGRSEFYFNQDIVEKLAPILRRLGARPRIINPGGASISLSARTAKARQMKADIFVSIHHDSVNREYKETWDVNGQMQEYSDRFSGFSVFFSSRNPMRGRSEKLAESIGESMLESGFKPTLHHAEKIEGENRPIIRKDIGLYEYTDLIVLKTARMPAALVECGVIVHRKEEAALRTPATQERISNAIADGIVRYWTRYGK
jgi:N-acetylmuramoyl-L-alanine amidase